MTQNDVAQPQARCACLLQHACALPACANPHRLHAEAQSAEALAAAGSARMCCFSPALDLLSMAVLCSSPRQVQVSVYLLVAQVQAASYV